METDVEFIAFAVALFSGFWSARFFLGAWDRLDRDEILATLVGLVLAIGCATLAFAMVRVVVESMT